MSLFHKKIKSDEYLELFQMIESLKIAFTSLKLELDLIIKKLKFKYKITAKDLKEEAEDIKDKVLLPSEYGII